MNYLKQIYYEMRHHKMMTWISICGTALAIFLVMAFIMSDNLNTMEVAPESARSRIMVGQNFHMEALNDNAADDGLGSTNGLSTTMARRLYEGLNGVESLSYVGSWVDTPDVNAPGEESLTLTEMRVDENYWKIYDYKLLHGRYFDEAERKADAKLAIVTRTTARRLFGEENVVGRQIEVRRLPYTIIGVVEDVSPLLSKSYGQIFRIFNVEGEEDQNDWFGGTNVRLLLKEGKDPKEVKREVEERYKRLSAEYAKQSLNPVYHDQPYTAEDVGAGVDGSNVTPSTERQRITRWIVYAILILLPAINLSSMTRSRLRHRVSEIGVRRAFGAKRKDIIGQLFGENLIITVIGGVIGLVLSLIFMMVGYNFLFEVPGYDLSLEALNARPNFSMLFRWSNFLIAFGICLILNILSATVPAWKASLTDPATALKSK